MLDDLMKVRVMFSDEWLALEVGYLVGRMWIEESPLYPDINIIPVQLSSYRWSRGLNVYLPLTYHNYPVVLI